MPLTLGQEILSTTTQHTPYTGGPRTQWVVRDAQNLTQMVPFSSGLATVVAVTTQPMSPPGPRQQAGSVPPQSTPSPPSPESSAQKSPPIPYEGNKPIPIIDESGSDVPSPNLSPDRPNSTDPVPSTIPLNSRSLYPAYLPNSGTQSISSTTGTASSSLPRAAQTVPPQGSISVSYSKVRKPSYSADPHTIPAPAIADQGGNGRFSDVHLHTGMTTLADDNVDHSSSLPVVTETGASSDIRDPDSVLPCYHESIGDNDGTESLAFTPDIYQGTATGKVIERADVKTARIARNIDKSAGNVSK